MTTTTKVILGIGGLGVLAYAIIKATQPQAKSGVVSFLDSAAGLVNAFRGSSSSGTSSTTSARVETTDGTQAYGTQDAAIADGSGYARIAAITPPSTQLTAQQQRASGADFTFAALR